MTVKYEFTNKSGLPAEMEEKQEPLKLNLQFFGDNPEDDPKDDPEELDDDDPEDDIPDLDELLKDKDFKKQYQAKLKEQLGKRMKKYEGVDPEEYRRLKEQADKKKDNKEGEEDEELETLKDELNQKEKRLLRAERREKRAIVKEFAVDNQVNPKLLARLIDVDDIELDEDGEPENLDELFEELEEEFPEYLGVPDEDEDEEDDEPKRKKRRGAYRPGSRQKSNKKTKEQDPRALGAAKAAERHKKEDDE